MKIKSIVSLRQYQRRHADGYFRELPWEIRRNAEMWLWRFQQRWGKNMPQWRLAILVGQARRLARNPPTSEWGRRMRAKKGGYAVQRRYRMEGRHPTETATQAHRANARIRREAKRRERLGLPPKVRHWFLPT